MSQHVPAASNPSGKERSYRWLAGIHCQSRAVVFATRPTQLRFYQLRAMHRRVASHLVSGQDADATVCIRSRQNVGALTRLGRKLIRVQGRGGMSRMQTRLVERSSQDLCPGGGRSRTGALRSCGRLHRTRWSCARRRHVAKHHDLQCTVQHGPLVLHCI
jgi:hypothetical protein